MEFSVAYREDLVGGLKFHTIELSFCIKIYAERLFEGSASWCGPNFNSLEW